MVEYGDRIEALKGAIVKLTQEHGAVPPPGVAAEQLGWTGDDVSYARRLYRTLEERGFIVRPYGKLGRGIYVLGDVEGGE